MQSDPRVLLQFGRRENDEFALDIHAPFTPLLAFAVALTSFESSIAESVV